MKKILNENVIVESVPIIGIYNKVINTQLKIVNRAEFYCLNFEAFKALDKAEALIMMQTYFLMIFKKAAMMSSLTCSFEGEDTETIPNELNTSYDILVNNLIETGFNSKVVII